MDALSFQVPILLRAENLGSALAHLTRLKGLTWLQHSLSKIHSSTTSQERRGKHLSDLCAERKIKFES
jgi:hypothetical protein